MTTFDPEKITFFAKTDARGQEVSFGIKAKDRQRHMYVVGKTGMGKSTLLENMAAQDIQNGEGMAFIDPHGSAAETLLEYVPEHRVKDVVYFAPFDLDNPISFNVMEDVGPDKRHLVVSGLMSTFKKIWVDAWSSRMEYILTNALLVLIEYPDTTLLSVNRLFSDKAYRKKVVEYCQDPAVKSFWVDEFANYTDRFAAEALPAIQNKIGQFTGNPLIRNIIGQPKSSFDIRQIMDEKKILIMNLSKGLVGETNANLLGSMLTTRIYLAAMSRADLPVAEMKLMPNFYFYVDEFQSFANATFANILSEARKYHLNLIIAHQYIEQMEEDVKSAVFGNVGTTVAFRVGPFDAEVLETVFSPQFEAADLVNLGFAQIYLTLMIDGIGSQPFSAKTLPPLELPEVSCAGMVVDASRKLYAQKREEVEKIVADLHTPTPVEKPEKKNGKRNNNNNYQQNNSFKPKPNNNFRNGRNNEVRKEYTPKPPVPEKTPDDLRQILAKMKQDTSSTKNDDGAVESKNKVPDKTKEFSSSSNKNHSNSQVKSKDKYQAKVDESKPAYVKNKDDLKSALAGVLKQEHGAEIKKEATAKKAESKSSETTGVTKPDNFIHKESAKPKFKNSDRRQPSQGRRTTDLKQKFSQSAQSNNLSKTQKSVREKPQNVLPNKLTDKTSTAVDKVNVTSSIDPVEIKRMLKKSDNERSPFN